MLETLDAAAVRRWCDGGLEALRVHQREIDDLNVYPVPDGDTGTNLVLTLTAAHEALMVVRDSGHIGVERPGPEGVAGLMRRMARGALLGARGNSGVIVSQILRGMADTFAGAVAVRGGELARALRTATDAAYAAVARPVEGTVLSVVAAAAEAAGRIKSDSLVTVAREAARAAAEALARTPQQLPVLADAGVVDAGGRGLCLLLDALVEAIDTDETDTAAARGDGVGRPAAGAAVVGVAGPGGGDGVGRSAGGAAVVGMAGLGGGDGVGSSAGGAAVVEAAGPGGEGAPRADGADAVAGRPWESADDGTGERIKAGGVPDPGALADGPERTTPMARGDMPPEEARQAGHGGTSSSSARHGATASGGAGRGGAISGGAGRGGSASGGAGHGGTISGGAGRGGSASGGAGHGGTTSGGAGRGGTTSGGGGHGAGEAGCSGYGFEVQYLLDATEEAVARLRLTLDRMGDSLVVVGTGEGDPPTWNVHVHVTEIGPAIEAGIEAGRPYRINVTLLEDRPTGSDQRGAVVVAAGDGLTALFEAEGAVVVDRNPSTAEMLAAVHATGARAVVLLPNDANTHAVAVSAAREAETMGVRVSVVPTRSPVQALAALAVRDAQRPFADDVIAMAEAAGACRYGEVCTAQRDAFTVAGRCRAGDLLGLVDGEVHVIGRDVAEVSRRLLDRMLGGGGELVTLVLGADAPPGFEDVLRGHVHRAWPFSEVQCYAGGQPRYHLLAGVE
ncbi:hypothetical protein Aph02nite_92530 [Actinoplanes philippinensis]|uniref:DAK2 domain-containing protein n=1 Tax=Actinoplanes philippinensis TaxID=35752 RepID=A0A1I2N163_9ACTN|nr:DAK2 domain-containing protein [Actinoplanes philippinensis]GIE83303.1 hypothetical protein Aph02nite_92530 [Actinoplanes philippinensis]SFF95111.1 DAK2 domain-containing protein [Actinoplanes philippinensis]